MIQSSKDNGIYYFLGNISSHILHALPLWEEVGGTFVVTSKQTEKDILKYNVPIVRVDDVPYKWMKPGKRPKRIHEYITLDTELKKTYGFLNTQAKVVIFYELFELKHPEWLTKPKKIFLTHGNMLKSYMTMHPKRLESIVQYDYMAALSPYIKKKLISEGVPQNKLVDIDIARTDVLLNEYTDRDAIREKITTNLGGKVNKPIILYIPTFWGESSIYHTGLEILEHIDQSYILLFRPHPQTPKKILKKYMAVIKRKDNVYLLDSDSSITLSQLLVASDLVAIDKSSAALEAILIDVPLLFVYDNASEERIDGYKSIEEIVSWSQKVFRGDKTIINEKIHKALSSGIDAPTWEKVRKRTWFYPKGGSINAIKDFIVDLTM